MCWYPSGFYAPSALGGYVAPARHRFDSAGSTISQSRWADRVEIRCFGRFQVSRDGVAVEHCRPGSVGVCCAAIDFAAEVQRLLLQAFPLVGERQDETT